ncbi:anthranilate phosphoribosyltransferase [Butyricicoccus sp. Marseille-Q5471]|uniref:anthranilate phosphoribosyltransferase n=1 Tax=Butyricicoccus sp. Marseille-Q5471 TaxID=3039493 RepID=UPI0024BCDA79|nr:anthranilate phosphoribosyltransferase [Butyricicoccus sp. Marseille-Q5471]
MMHQAIHEAINGRNLDYHVARAAMEQMMEGTASEVEMATLLTALRMKGETITEITACAEVMREKGAHIEPKGAVMDIVGTGGDEVGSFNISTTAAFVAAAGGVPIAKHGNRSVSSKSGAADVLEQLGVVLNLSPAQNERVLAETGICFLFAQGYHKSMKNVAPVRKGMGERTLFNVLGPLSNPARATMQLLGVYDPKLVEPMAKVLSNLGVTRGMVVCGNGMDEASLLGENKACEIRFGELKEYSFTPEDLGLARCTVDELRGGSPADNAQITRDVLSGREQGAKRDIILLNAGIALYLGIDGLQLTDGIARAAELIDSGAAYRKLEQFIAATQEAAQ